MARHYSLQDLDYSQLLGQKIAIIGYGNQGRAQALNLADRGIEVIIGNRADEYGETALRDGLQVCGIASAVRQADIICLLLPDEQQAEIFDKDVRLGLTPGKTLLFGHGFNIHFQRITIPPDVDVGLVAPVMIGQGVRDNFTRNLGFPVLVAVHQDSTGRAWPHVLAYAGAIGADPALESSFEEETIVDLFAEQVGGGSYLYSMLLCFDILVGAGVDPEVAVLELYGSGEMIEVMRSVVEKGLLDSLKLHSHTSQYGQVTRGERLVPPESRQVLQQIMDEIRSGQFAAEFDAERRQGFARYRELLAKLKAHPASSVEKMVRSYVVRTEKHATLPVWEPETERTAEAGDD